uniref:Small ribosomal subunit protein uS14c n=1 Tax=Sciadococcus taiwanensis TaxID=3028030 RepID=A0A9Y1MWS9_9RHOD|nr:ribosomal protein S14 [Sciadococcus taiwanensis]
MAKKSMVQRNLKRIRMAKKYQKKRLEIKNQIETTTSTIKKIELSKKLEKLPLNSLPVRINNRCWSTGRSRGYYRDFGLSRHVLREMAHNCLLPGVMKSSW